MRQVWSRILVVTLAACATTAGAAAAPPKEPTYTTYTDFEVPFSFPASQANGDPPRVVELHVSADQARTWEVASRAKPSEGRLVFRAPKDGEYWFMPRTKYASGRYLPEGPPIAQLKVVVDTEPPQLELDAQHGGGGELIVRWHIADAHLLHKSFKLEYRLSGATEKWQHVAVDPADAQTPPFERRGETTLVLPLAQQDADLVVRAEVIDAAGNHSIKEQPVSSGDPPLFASPAGSIERTPAMPASYPRTATPDWPAEEGESPFGDSNNEGAGDDHPPSRSPVQRLPDLSSTAAGAAAADGALVPPGVKPQMVNKPRLELLYDVDAIGSAGVAQVELWITTDGGRTWTSYGLDEDCHSPMLVQVEGEGVYGFRVVVETTTGLRSPLPVAGDLPDVWVGVDLTKPDANLISAVQGEGDEADRLIISWQAADRSLAVRGISLFWSQTRQGPWSTIASGLENTGRYAWRLDQRLPGEVYLLLEVRDDAGNVGTDSLPDAISLERIRPLGRILQVRPLSALPPGGELR